MAHDSREDAADDTRRAGELTQVESALAGLAPRPARIDSARLLYLAGRESASSRHSRLAWVWPVATAVSTLAASVFGVLLAWQPEPQVVERIVYVQQAAPAEGEGRLVEVATHDDVRGDAALPPARVPSFAPHYLQSRNLAVSHGIDSLPAQGASQGSIEIRPATHRELQHRILEGESTGFRKLPEPSFYSWPGILNLGGSR